MKKMRRVVSALAVLALLFTTFSCSSPETPENPKSEKEKDDAGKTDEPGSSDKPAQGSIVIDEGTSDASEEVGIKLTITVPANSSSLAIFRWDITDNPNEFVGREIYETKNESNTAKTITFYDKYGIKKDHSYKYATATNYGERTEWGEAVKAKADGWEPPVLDKAPEASFENASFTYTQVPHVSFKNSENYGYAFSPAYLFKTPWWMVEGAKESDGDFVDWDYGLWFGYNTEHPNDKSFGIGEDHRGLLLTLNDYNLTVFVDKGKNLNYVAYYEADAFDFPQTIYAENKVVEEGNDLVFTIPVPAGTHNVSLMKYDEKLKDYFEIASKPYPGDEPNPGKTEIKLKDLYEHEKGKEGKYFVTYDGKRYDGYDYDKKQGGGISYTPKEMSRKQPVISDIKVVFDGSNIQLTKAPKIENVTINKETNYWFILDYLDAENPNNEDGRVSVWFHRGACEDSEKKTVEHDVTDMQKNLTNGQKLALRTLRFNYAIEEDGLMWDVHYNVPFAELDVPANLTINKEINTSDIKAENQISMSISFPERLAAINILRREVDNAGKPVTDYEQIGWQGPKANDKEHFEIAQTKNFTDRYTVQKDHYYEYKAEFIDEDWNYKGQQNLGIHLAGKDGYPKPVFSESNYPEIIVEYTDKGPLFKITNEDALNSMNYSSAEATPFWISFNLWYSNGVTDFYPWLGSYGTANRTFQISNAEFWAAGTGVYSLQSFCINDQFQGDYFDRQFWYDVKDLDTEKILPAINNWPNEMKNGGFELDIKLPFYYYNQEKEIQDIYVQCREKPATDPYKWEPVVAEPAVRKGCLSKEIFKGRVKDGIVHFKDYYGFEKGKTYQYRALVRVDENWDVIDLPLCEVTPTKDSFAIPAFKDGVKPEFNWDAETQTLTATNKPALDVSAALLAEWGCGDKYEWAVSSGYLGETDGGFWPWFLLKSGDTWNELYTTFSVDDWNNLGNEYSMTANEYYLEIYIPGEGIGQCIPLSTDDLGTAKTLTRP